MNIILNIEPPKHTAQGSSTILKTKSGRFFIGKKKNSNAMATKQLFYMLLKKYVPKEPLTGAVELNVKWNYSYRKSEPKKNKEKDFIYCDKRPDCDNLLKLLQDVLTDMHFWNDDGQVAKLSFEKKWCKTPSVEIRIEKL